MNCKRDIRRLADALGELRQRIRALKEEEAGLRQAILDARPNGAITGAQFTLQVRVQSRRRFDTKLLPDHIRDDPRYWHETQCRTLTTRPAREAPPPSTTEDFDVFEPY